MLEGMFCKVLVLQQVCGDKKFVGMIGGEAEREEPSAVCGGPAGI